MTRPTSEELVAILQTLFALTDEGRLLAQSMTEFAATWHDRPIKQQRATAKGRAVTRGTFCRHCVARCGSLVTGHVVRQTPLFLPNFLQWKRRDRRLMLELIGACEKVRVKPEILSYPTNQMF